MAAKEQPPREKEIFEQAFDIASPEMRAGFLNGACANDAQMRERIEALLRASERAEDFLPEKPVNSPTAIIAAITEKPGDMIGRYKLLEKIGEGGMGVVYMAEQCEPVVRKVALKLINLGMDTRQVVARFEAERQALALMDHPHIAKVLDAGATETGRPYLVMELVQGVPITEFCDQNQLSAKERIRLFIPVCQAIQSAHQKAIIHRDLKPSNVLVTLNGGVPHPMVIDFGVAKATNQKLTEKTLFTNFATMIGTPAYMSPEQAEMSKLDVDTRADIYSLGVLLYELLSGTTPFPEERLRSVAYGEMQRIIVEEEPERLSTRLTKRLAASTAHASAKSARRIPHAAIDHDLDWIVMKCLEKDRSRRYETANGLAADIQRHLSNEPVVACPPSAVYRFQKAVRRNKVAFTAAGAIAFSLVLGLGLAIWQAVRAHAAQREQTRLRLQAEASERTASTEAIRSERVSRFFEKMLKGVGPSVALGRDTILIREILDKTAQSLSADLKEEPSVEAQLRNTVAEIYLQLGDLPRAEAMVREALALRTRLNGGEHKEVAHSLDVLGNIHFKRNEQAKAEGAHLEALALRRRLFGDSHQDVRFSLNNLGNALGGRGDLAGAEARYREAMEMDRRHKVEQGSAALNLAGVLGARGEYAEAEKLLRQNLEIVRKKKGNEHPDVASLLEQLAVTFADQGKLEEAERFNREALAIYRKVMGENHPELVRALQNLAYTLRLKGDLAGVEAAYREALAICRQSPGNDDKLASALFMVSTVLRQRRQFAESESFLRESLAIRERLHGRESREVAEALSNLGILVSEAGDHVQAERYARECLAIRQKLFGPHHPDVIGALNNLGWALANQNLWPEAEKTLQTALDTLDRTPSAKPEARRLPVGNMISVLSRQGKFAELESFLEKALQTATDPGLKALHLETRGSLHARMGRWPEAAADYARAIELQSDNHEPYHKLAPLLVSNRDLDGYRKHCAKEIERFRDTKDANVAERMAKDCLILPNSGADLKVIAAWAELAVTVGQKSDDLPWFQHVKGLAEYRQGHFAEAIEWAQKALIRSGDKHRDSQATAVLAMAQQQAGQRDAARASLARAVELEGKLPKLESGDIGDDWLDWIIAQTLLREARNLIEGEPASIAAPKRSDPKEANP